MISIGWHGVLQQSKSSPAPKPPRKIPRRRRRRNHGPPKPERRVTQRAVDRRVRGREVRQNPPQELPRIVPHRRGGGVSSRNDGEESAPNPARKANGRRDRVAAGEGRSECEADVGARRLLEG